MITHYFAPQYRADYAIHLMRRRGQSAWRHFINATAAHDLSDSWVRDFRWMRLKSYPVQWAMGLAEAGKNHGRPEQPDHRLY